MKTGDPDSLAQELVARGQFYLLRCKARREDPRALGPRLGQARCRSGRSPLAVTRRLELEGAGRRAEAARELGWWSVREPALVEASG